MSDKVLLKDLLFNRTEVEKLAIEIHRAYPAFNKKQFAKKAVSKFSQLELKARISWIAECLKEFLPTDFEEAVAKIIRALPAPNNPALTDGDFGEFIYAPYGEYVAQYGCEQRYLKISLNALYEITQRFSVEYSIRNFLNAFPDQTLNQLDSWSKDSHYHVRRLCSEGTRPKLPWAQKISIPFQAAIPLLNNLYSDSTRYVTRSVANHINDISKIDPDYALRLLKQWQDSAKQTKEEMSYITRHGLRTLIKHGNPKAFQMLGVGDCAGLKVAKLKYTKQVKLNQALSFSFELKAAKTADLIVDYIVYFRNKAGKLNNKKVFKLSKIKALSGQRIIVSKNHVLKSQMTTRTLYPGVHKFILQINGKQFVERTFVLEK